MLEIVNAPNPILAQSAKPVTIRYLAKQIYKVDGNLLKLIEEMKETLDAAKDPVGVGLAAPQVGKSLRLFIAKPTPKSKAQVFINPRIISNIKYQALRKSAPIHNTPLEGCLSLVNIWGEVKRQKELKLSYLDETGKKHTKLFKGFPAIVIQHEIDHLDGILFPKRVLEQKGKLYKSKKNKKGEDVFEEIEI